jgi:hypothetical protein
MTMMMMMMCVCARARCPKEQGGAGAEKADARRRRRFRGTDANHRNQPPKTKNKKTHRQHGHLARLGHAQAQHSNERVRPALRDDRPLWQPQVLGGLGRQPFPDALPELQDLFARPPRPQLLLEAQGFQQGQGRLGWGGVVLGW